MEYISPYISSCAASIKGSRRRIIAAVLILVSAALAVLLLYRAAYAKAEKLYAEKYRVFVLDYEEEAERNRVEALPTSEESSRRADANEIARVLYGVKDNSTTDLRTLCWCIFNRVDSQQYPDTVQGVIAQPKQWMGYSPDSAVLESLYIIAREELDKWRDNDHRQCDASFVFMEWSSEEIKLRDTFDVHGAKYWRMGE